MSKKQSNLMRNNNGFVTTLILIFLPLVISLILYFFISEALILLQKKPLYVCRTEGLQAFHQYSVNLNKLFDLNPKAQQLRLKLKILQAEKAAAIAQGNLPLAGMLETQIETVRAIQLKLDLKQRALILKMETELNAKAKVIDINLNSALVKFKKELTSFLVLNGKTLPDSSFISVEIVPDQSGIAPVYETKSNFTSIQAKAWSWQIQLSPHPIWKKWFNFNWRINSQCTVSLTQNLDQFSETLVVKH